MKCYSAAVVALLSQSVSAFVAPAAPSSTGTVRFSATLTEDVAEDSIKDKKELERQRLKQALFGKIGGRMSDDKDLAYDAILADPETKESLSMALKGPILGGGAPRSGISLTMRSSIDSDRVFEGRTNTYINLLEPASDASSDLSESEDDEKTSVSKSPLLSSLLTFTPPPLRPFIANATNSDVEYIPMRDLFTSPSVSFAYERGWRQGFAAAGFPGADKEFELAKEYFDPVIATKNANKEDSVLVDMSCATGMSIFTTLFSLIHRQLCSYMLFRADCWAAECLHCANDTPSLTHVTVILDP